MTPRRQEQLRLRPGLISKKLKISYEEWLQVSSLSLMLYFTIENSSRNKQAGTGPSRRHIQGSKIAKRLPSVKYSFTVLENRKFFEKFFLKKLHTKKMDRVARRGSLARAPGALKSHNAEKLKGGTL